MSSGRRTAHCFAKLISHVSPDRVYGGFAFDGAFFPPGAAIELDSTESIVVIECCGFSKWVYEENKRQPLYLYILWRWDAVRGWREQARSSSWTWSWSLDLGPIAARLLEEIHGAASPVSLAAVQRRIAGLLDAELEQVDVADRGALLGIIHDQLAARIAGGK